MNQLFKYIKFLLCSHSKDIFIRNIFGDEIIFNTPNYHRSIWGCRKCNSQFWDMDLNKSKL